MSVRVWLKPNELGEQGYSIDFPEADGYRVMKDGTLRLTVEDREADGQVGRVVAGRWDAVVVLEEAEDE